jgi:hypothetical protein
MATRIRRIVVVAMAATGLLALLGTPAVALINMQHCEPMHHRGR